MTWGWVVLVSAVLSSAAQAQASAGTIVIPPDSARADSAAFAALPPALRVLLDVRRALTDRGALTCVALSTTSAGEVRRRVQGTLPDSTSLVVFVRARVPQGAISRVEFIRVSRKTGQRGFTWDGESRATTGIDWNADRSRATSYPMPAGSPVPRTLRALGRLVLQFPCRS